MVTRNDVAKLAQVSPAVVSYVINNSNYVSEEKRRAVLAAIKELNYIPNLNARNLRQGRTRMIAVIRGSQLNDMFNDLLFYLENIANSHGYQIASTTVLKTEDNYATDSFVNSLISRHYDAIFITNSSVTEQQINRLAKSGTKILLYVTRDYSLTNQSVGYIIPHYRQGVKLIINKLLDLGHKRISILPNLSYPMGQASLANHRYAGYSDAFAEHRLPIDMRYIPASCATLNDICKSVSAMLDKGVTAEPPTAFCADEPYVVATVLKQLTSMGLRVPQDVSLACFSNSTLASLTTPELCSVGFDPEQFAEISLNMMEALIDGQPGCTRLIPLDYHERSSIAAPPETTIEYSVNKAI